MSVSECKDNGFLIIFFVIRFCSSNPSSSDSNRIDEFLLKCCSRKSNSSVQIRLATPKSAMAEQTHFDDDVMTTLRNALPHLCDQLVRFIEDNADVHWKLTAEPNRIKLSPSKRQIGCSSQLRGNGSCCPKTRRREFGYNN